MPAIFSNNAGMVTAVPGTGFPVLDLFLDGWEDASTVHAILTGVAVKQQGVFQLQHSLDEKLWLYLFSEAVGELAISGLAFSRFCLPDSNLEIPQSHGLELVREYYNEFRVTRTGAPLTVVLGLFATFQAFLVGYQASTNDPVQGLGQFILHLVTVPENAIT